VINPRGFRGYVRNDTFFRAIPLVLARRPDARFVCVAMAAETRATTWVRELGIGHAVELLPALRPAEMAEAYRRAQVLVSPSVHDGTPNTTLEGLACGCFPVAGDLESIREWIADGVNGLLVDPTSPRRLADAIVTALDDRDLRVAAAAHNRELIAARADANSCSRRVDAFYGAALARGQRAAPALAQSPSPPTSPSSVLWGSSAGRRLRGG
jgi:glycosyltransferase involved in cell wall biosynthesis